MKRAICHIPSGEMLRLKPVSHWLDRFRDFTRRSAMELVLPAVGFSGPLFESRVHPVPPAYRHQELLPRWIREARDLMGEAGVVWANLIIDGQFLDNPAIWQKNQHNQEISQFCITHPAVQGVLHEMISEILQLGVDGIVLDLTDAYPNSGSNAYQGVSGHCFCRFCIEAMRLKGFRESLLDAFVGPSDLLRFCLYVEADGTNHIDPPQSWLDGRNASALVALSVARRFIEGDRSELESQALRLLSYLRARVAVTADSVRSVLAPCRESNSRSAVILGSPDCDWCQMVTIEALHSITSATEYWIPDPADRDGSANEASTVQFLAARSTYYFNRFFEIVETAESFLIAHGMERFLDNLMKTSKAMMNNKLGPGAAHVVETHLPEFSGFAGVPLGQQDHLDMLEQLTEEVSGVVLPKDILLKFRILEPSP